MKLWLIPTFAIWYVWKLFYLLLCHYHWVSNPCLIRNWKIVIFLLFLFLFFLFTLSDLVLQADLVLKIAILCVYVCMIANEWFFLLCVVTLMCFLIGFLSPLGCILSAHLDSVTLKSIHSCTKRHVLWRHGSFQIESSLTRSPKDNFKIWSEVLNWQPMSQIHSANIFLLQWLLWVVVFCFYLCNIF